MHTPLALALALAGAFLPILAQAQQQPQPQQQSTITSLSPSQSQKIDAALAPWASSLRNSPALSSIGLNLFLNVEDFNINDLSALNPVAVRSSGGGGIDYLSLATAPPALIAAQETQAPKWYSEAGPSLRAGIQSVQSQALQDAVNIVRGQIGYARTTLGGGASESKSSSVAAATRGQFVSVVRGTEGVLLALGAGVCGLAFWL